MVDINYYKNIIMTQRSSEILLCEMEDLIKELEEERKESIQVQAKVKPACETLQIIDEMLREAYILKEHKDYIYNLDNAERLRGYKLALQRLKQKIVSK